MTLYEKDKDELLDEAEKGLRSIMNVLGPVPPNHCDGCTEEIAETLTITESLLSRLRERKKA